MKNLIIIITSLFTLCNLLLAQCDESLIEKAALKNGVDAILIRDFKAKLGKGTMKNPLPVAKYRVYLQNGSNYRFSIANDTTLNSAGILQLYDKQLLMGSTYNLEEKKDEQIFTYKCEKTSSYMVMMSFNKSEEGCAAGVMSMIIYDTSDILLSKVELPVEYDTIFTDNILYAGIDNPIQIVATDIPGGIVHTSLSCGEIRGNHGEYIINIDSIGETTLTVIAKDKDGKINDSLSKVFIVKELPPPDITYANLEGGLISKEKILLSTHIVLYYPTRIENIPYEIIEFSITDNLGGLSGYKSYNKMLTMEQKSFLQNLNRGDKFYINEIYIRSNYGKIHKLSPLGFIIE